MEKSDLLHQLRIDRSEPERGSHGRAWLVGIAVVVVLLIGVDGVQAMR